MKRAVMVRPGQIDFEQASTPEIGAGQVLLQVKAIGVCGSDMHVWHGKHPFVTYPLVQGHEYSAVVADVGPGVTGVKPGDRVTATPQETCGTCRPCRRGQYNACEVLKVRGFQAPGCAQDYFATEADKLVRLPHHMTFEQGAFVEPVAVAAHVTGRLGNISGQHVVVSGAGTIGNLVAQACRIRGAARVLITDISDYRLTVATQVGIASVCNVARTPLHDVVAREFGPDGFDIGIEVSGAEAGLSALVREVGKGGTLVIVGVFGEKPRVDMSVVCEHELAMIGSMMYRHDDWTQAVEWLAQGSVKTSPLVSKHFAFNDYADAYRFLDAQGDKAMKVIIDLGGANE